MTNEISTSQIICLIKKLEAFMNDSRFLPATSFYRSKVLLALISKALTVARAVCALVDADFPAEAFGMSRTLAEIFFTVRYLSNKDTEKRTAKYVEHVGKTHEELIRLSAKFFPEKHYEPTRFDRDFTELAKNYKSAHSWADLRGQAKLMALEEDSYEFDEKTGEPIKQEFDYELIYWWTSQFVHATVRSLYGHGTEQGTPFRIRGSIREEAGYSDLALFNVLAFVSKTIVCAFRGLRDEQPADILEEMRQVMSSYAQH
jgi:hypothetical protein